MKTFDAAPCTIYIVRHAQSMGNIGHHFSSPLTDLTPHGLTEARILTQRLRKIHFDAILSSEYVRAKRTAEVIAKERRLAVITKEALRERSFGIVEGKKEQEMTEELKKLLAFFRTLPEKDKWNWKKIEKMESDEEAVSRFITILREIAIAYGGKTILIVAHGGIMRNFLVRLGWGAPEELPPGSIKNTGYIKVDSDGVDFFVRETFGIDKRG